MPLDPALTEFLTSPVMIIIATHGEALHPEIARGNGALARADSGTVDLVISGWLWPGTLRNLRAGSLIAATFARPRDYAAFQIKGTATLVEPQPEHLRLSAHYMNGIREALTAQGLEAPLIDPWLSDRDPAVARITVLEAYEQTPGPRAGRALGSA